MARPRQDHSSEIDKEYPAADGQCGLVIKSISGYDNHGHVMVICQCTRCGKKAEKPQRLTAVRSGHSTSCGCKKRQNYSDNANRQVDKLAPETVAEYWDRVQTGESSKKIASANEIAKQTVDFAIRRYQQRLDSLSETQCMEIHALVQRENAGVAADLFGITERAALYVSNRVHKQLKKAAAQQEMMDRSYQELRDLLDDPNVEFEIMTQEPCPFPADSNLAHMWDALDNADSRATYYAKKFNRTLEDGTRVQAGSELRFHRSALWLKRGKVGGTIADVYHEAAGLEGTLQIGSRAESLICRFLEAARNTFSIARP